MGHTHLIVFAAIFATVFAASISSDPFVSAFNKLPDNEKENFLTYFLAQGVMQKSVLSLPGTRGTIRSKDLPGLNITQSQLEKFQGMNIPESSVNKFIGWTKRRFELDDSSVATLAKRGEVCNSQGLCVTVPDVGIICCPW